MTTEKRTCDLCGETKEAVKGIWMTTRGKPVGRVCLACVAAKKRGDRATEEGRAAANAQSVKSKTRLVVSPRTGNLIRAGSAHTRKHFSQSKWHKLKAWVSQETNALTWAIVRDTDKSDMRFQRLFGVTREEYRQHLLSQLGEHRLEDYQVTWQLDHRQPLAGALSSNELMDLARIENCFVLGLEAHSAKSLADTQMVRGQALGI
jgi:hypothetical protein